MRAAVMAQMLETLSACENRFQSYRNSHETQSHHYTNSNFPLDGHLQLPNNRHGQDHNSKLIAELNDRNRHVARPFVAATTFNRLVPRVLERLAKKRRLQDDADEDGRCEYNDDPDSIFDLGHAEDADKKNEDGKLDETDSDSPDDCSRNKELLTKSATCAAMSGSGSLTLRDQSNW